MKVWLAVSVLIASATPALADARPDPDRGAYVARLGGCHTCHTDVENGGPPLAGGRAMKTPFGVFRVPNITPDAETGIGGWDDADFARAMTQGIGPDDRRYYPAFPFTSYTLMTKRDLRDLKAFLDAVEPVKNRVAPHDLRFPYGFRPALRLWNWLFFAPGAFEPAPGRTDAWNRGAYLVNGPGHCGECHTERNMFGALERDKALAGTRNGPDGKPVPNITPHAKDGIGLWSAGDLAGFLKTGLPPFGEEVGQSMLEVIEVNTSHWTPADRDAVAEYLLSLPARATP